MGVRTFDRKFGKDRIREIPLEPGIYIFRDAAGVPIYVGKAKILRRRLAQYRNAKRLKRHRKMKLILRESESLEVRVCEGERDALLLENEWIRIHRPRLNLAGAFSFIYPVIALRVTDGITDLAYTTDPAPWEEAGFRLFGTFRSRHLTKEAFVSLCALLARVGHREPRRGRMPRVRFSLTDSFRRVPPEGALLLSDFLRGKDRSFLEWIFGELLEKAGARRDATDVQERLTTLVTFHRHEVTRLDRARKSVLWEGDFVPQEDRDRLFIEARA